MNASNIRAAHSIFEHLRGDVIACVQPYRATGRPLRSSVRDQSRRLRADYQYLGEMRPHKKDMTRDDAALDCFNELRLGEVSTIWARLTHVLLCSSMPALGCTLLPSMSFLAQHVLNSW